MRYYLVALLLIATLAACGGGSSPPAQTRQIEVTRIVEATRIVPQTVEVTRLAQVVVTATPRPATPTPKPTATPTGPQLASRANPVPFRESYPLAKDKTKKFHFTITDSLRGEEAYKKLLAANQFNDPPDEGMEYLMVFASLEYLEGPQDDPLQFYKYDLSILSQGQILDAASVVEPDPEFDISFFPGASGGGWVTFEIPSADADPLLAIGMDYAGRGGFYFATHP